MIQSRYDDWCYTLNRSGMGPSRGPRALMCWPNVGKWSDEWRNRKNAMWMCAGARACPQSNRSEKWWTAQIWQRNVHELRGKTTASDIMEMMCRNTYRNEWFSIVCVCHSVHVCLRNGYVATCGFFHSVSVDVVAVFTAHFFSSLAVGQISISRERGSRKTACASHLNPATTQKSTKATTSTASITNRNMHPKPKHESYFVRLWNRWSIINYVSVNLSRAPITCNATVVGQWQRAATTSYTAQINRNTISGGVRGTLFIKAGQERCDFVSFFLLG